MGEIQGDNATALEEQLAAAKESELGFPMLKIGDAPGLPYDAVVSVLKYDEIIAAGGTGEGGGFTAIVRVADFPDGLPAKFTPIEARGMALQVLGVERNIAHAIITAGDPVDGQ